MHSRALIVLFLRIFFFDIDHAVALDWIHLHPYTQVLQQEINKVRQAVEAKNTPRNDVDKQSFEEWLRKKKQEVSIIGHPCTLLISPLYVPDTGV